MYCVAKAQWLPLSTIILSALLQRPAITLRSPACVDMQIVDLPGFRDFALDSSKQELCNRSGLSQPLHMRFRLVH